MHAHEEQAEAFVAMAKRKAIDLNETGSLDQAAGLAAVAALKEELGEDSPSKEALGTLAACLAQLQAKSPVFDRHLQKTSVDFVATWALASPLQRRSVDPNEKRFLAWASAKPTDWNSFFDASVIGARVMITYRRPFDLRSLYRWVVFRDQEPYRFEAQSLSTFKTWQAPAEWVPMVDASRHDPELCRALITDLMDRGWSRSSLSEKLGVSSQYLGMLLRGNRTPSYCLQVALEILRGPAEAPRLDPPKKK